MSTLSAAGEWPVAAVRLSVERLRCLLLWLTGFAGAFVFIEPSPYEVVALTTIVIFALAGLSFQRITMPMVLLLVLLDLGHATAMLQVYDEPKPLTWVLISIFLAVTAMFYAAMLGSNTEVRLKWLMRGYLFAAVLASLFAIAGSFNLLGGASSLFVLYDRARGTFNDPNVLGAFLVLPGLLLLQRILAGRLSAVIGSGFLLLILLVAILLTFSRAAWAQFVLSAVVLMALTFGASRSPTERLRIVLLALAGTILIALLVVALVSIGDIGAVFKQRAALEQSYDIGHYGRFGRYFLGAELALDRPFGLGPLQFSRYFTEDPHNTFLNAFMSGGWLAGFAYLTIAFLTLTTGLRFVYVATPWRAIYQAVYAAFVGVTMESAIIDIDHWRHYFLILGVLWGLMAASRAFVKADRQELDPPGFPANVRFAAGRALPAGRQLS